MGRGVLKLTAAAIVLAAGGASADSAPAPVDLSRFADPAAIVLAVRAEFAPAGGAVRLSAYEEAAFLEAPAAKAAGTIDDEGIAVLSLPELAPGTYAFVAYYDKNGDGKLNRGALGKPKEPYVFSNDVKPKLRKPRFEETRVAVAPGEVVVLTLKD